MGKRLDAREILIANFVRQAREASPEAFTKRLKAALSLDRPAAAHLVDTPIGWLAAKGLRRGGIDGRQLEAAEAYRGLRVVSLGRLEAETMNYRDLMREAPDDDPMTRALGPDAPPRRGLTEIDRRILSLRYGVWRKLLRRDGDAFAAVDRIVIHQVWPRWFRKDELTLQESVELLALRRGLDRLADHRAGTRE